MAPRVLAKKLGIPAPEGSVYVGRPSKWGNPFKIGDPYGNEPAMSRQQTIDQFRDWLLYSDQGLILYKDIEELRGKDLVCWCAPKPCHADILLELANAT